MNRKKLFLLWLAGMSVLRVFWHLNGTKGPETIPAFFGHALFDTLAIPGYALVWLLYALGIEISSPVASVALIWMLLFWFFPAGRVQRWFGVFNPFGEGKRRRAVLVRGVAYALDMLNKRLFGRQKTGGWA